MRNCDDVQANMPPVYVSPSENSVAEARKPAIARGSRAHGFEMAANAVTPHGQSLRAETLTLCCLSRDDRWQTQLIPNVSAPRRNRRGRSQRGLFA